VGYYAWTVAEDERFGDAAVIKIQKSRNPKIQESKNPGIQKSRNTEIHSEGLG
jgi:hypothetical protein